MSLLSLTDRRLRRGLVVLCMVNGVTCLPRTMEAPAGVFRVLPWPGQLLVVSLQPGSALPPQLHPGGLLQPAPSVLRVHVWVRDLHGPARAPRARFTLPLRVLRGVSLGACLGPLALLALVLAGQRCSGKC